MVLYPAVVAAVVGVVVGDLAVGRSHS